MGSLINKVDCLHRLEVDILRRRARATNHEREGYLVPVPTLEEARCDQRSPSNEHFSAARLLSYLHP